MLKGFRHLDGAPIAKERSWIGKVLSTQQDHTGIPIIDSIWAETREKDAKMRGTRHSSGKQMLPQLYQGGRISRSAISQYDVQVLFPILV